MAVTLNDKPVLRAEIHEPLVGVWGADVEVDDDDAATGAVVLNVDGVEFHGTVRSGDVDAGRAKLRIFGGSDGLKEEIGSQFYRDVTVSGLLTDVCRQTGETKATLESAIANTTFAKHMRSAGTGSDAIALVASDAGANWRVTREGEVWIGTETWPEAIVPGIQIDAQHGSGSVTWAPDDGALVGPGMTFQGRHVGKVTTLVTPRGIRQSIWFEDASSSGDRLIDAIRRIILKVVGKRLDYSALYPSTVVSQAANGNVEIKCDDSRIAGRGLTAIPIKHGIPGMTVEVQRGARVLLGFEAQDPGRPYVALWESGSVTKLTLPNGTSAVARKGDRVRVFFPPLMAINGTVGVPPAGTPFTGVLTITTPADGAIDQGNESTIG